MVTLEQIRAAQQRIRGVAFRTPLVRFGATAGSPDIFLKLESLQPIGSFKLRGAYNMVAQLSDAERARGIIAHSSGNHAQGAAYAARAKGCRATIVLPDSAPQVKVEATRALGAEIVLSGPRSQERIDLADQIARERGLVMVPPYNDERIIQGTGTITLEILEDLPEVDLILTPVSGGGLISGIAAAAKLSNPKLKVIGVEPELAADAQDSLRKGERTAWDADAVTRTIADGLRTTPVGEIPWQHIKTYVDDIVTVSEADIRATVRRLLLTARILAEPSGAVAPAAALLHADKLPPAKKIAAVVSGGNIAPEMLREIMAES